MKQDRIRWNEKFDAQRGMGDPSPWVQSMYKTAPGRRALDLTAGLGRNAVFLARQGFDVMALDLADRAMESLKAHNLPNIFPVQADLDTFPVRQESFDLVICCHFLDRRLFPYIQESLKLGGILLYESALESDQPLTNQPRNRDYLLRTNELLHVFLCMRIISYQESVFEEAKGSGEKRALARVAAQKGWTGDEPLVRIS
ncbi:MAG: methyltransferase domain-containing protein [Desulfovermiculus sp.]|nr:methyltransferase domain-containing protein [Desulfovermiculus sp.]